MSLLLLQLVRPDVHVHGLLHHSALHLRPVHGGTNRALHRSTAFHLFGHPGRHHQHPTNENSQSSACDSKELGIPATMDEIFGADR